MRSSLQSAAREARKSRRNGLDTGAYSERPRNGKCKLPGTENTGYILNRECHRNRKYWPHVRFRVPSEQEVLTISTMPSALGTEHTGYIPYSEAVRLERTYYCSAPEGKRVLGSGAR